MLPLIPIALKLALGFAPTLISHLMGKNAGKVADQVVDIAKAVTGEPDPEEIIRAMENSSPEMAIQFQQATNQLTIELEQENTKRIEAINLTMQAESKSNHWAQYLWRPFNGFLFGITIFFDYFAAQFMVGLIKRWWDVVIQLEHVPMEVYILWSAVLGVAAWTRGKEKETQIKTNALEKLSIPSFDSIKDIASSLFGKK